MFIGVTTWTLLQQCLHPLIHDQLQIRTRTDVAYQFLQAELVSRVGVSRALSIEMIRAIIRATVQVAWIKCGVALA
jgi:hypothetical protein